MNMTPEQIAALDSWLADRPPIIRELAYKYPPGTCFQLNGKIFYVVSYYEDGSLGISPVDPAVDYDKACKLKQSLCTKCFPL